ncbi:LemA protein [Acidovorax sp. 69]|uniref:LemA family protein n=1 Tax=Acidovorax sp. 69 TaxID=2035202 RepID=UPI000C234862|nr:LemA family protein [Acidovorax sp. 69]PJI99464.1 LemA protein [Acidovorax sp. 69]
MLWSSPLFWIVFAVSLFWALGAYNRLMRLRSSVVQSFGSFDAHMVRLVALLGEFGAAHLVQRGRLLSDSGEAEVAALQGAVTQLSASLAVARARPLRADAVAALTAAREMLQATWKGAVGKLEEASAASEPVSAAAQEPALTALSIWQARWAEHSVQTEQAVRVFNDAVLQYNAAIAQFPASLLAWVFGFKAARVL